MFRKRFSLGLTAISLLGLPSFLWAQEEAGKAANSAQRQENRTEAAPAATTEVARKERPKIKTFELKHANPSELAQFISYRTQATTGGLPSAGFGAAPAGGFGQASMPPQAPNVAFDDERRLLIVRGTSGEISRIEKLVRALDVSAEKIEKQSFGNVHLIPLRNSEAVQIQSVLSQLGVSTNAVQLGKASVIVVHDAENDEAEQIEELIAMLDKPGKRSTGARTTESSQSTESEGR